MDWDIVIGLEVHVQLNTETKAFCSCKVNYGDPPNTNVCPVCLAYPGALPVLNKELVNSAVKLGLATNCSIRPYSTFARKNYFYPDLPKGYQISQFDDPICYEGYVDIEVDGKEKRIGLTRIHMEEDAGKSMHSESGTLVDLNRCGTPLLEIVSEPDMFSPQEAYAYLTTIKQIVRYTEVSDCNMEEGSMQQKGNKKFLKAVVPLRRILFFGMNKAVKLNPCVQKRIHMTTVISPSPIFHLYLLINLGSKICAKHFRSFPQNVNSALLIPFLLPRKMPVF